MADTPRMGGTPRGAAAGRRARRVRATRQDEVDVDEFARIGAEGQGSTDDEAGSHVCSVAFCPISMALSAVEVAKPDAVEHLLAAGREFLLATKAVLDARAGQTEGGSTRLEKIHID